ncbi:MAG: ribosomal-processing cysteine protease Prp [Bacilli bacterium]
MIKIDVKKNDNKINYISVRGHSGYDEYGKDIVCASASTIIITSVNAILRIDESSITYKQDEGFIDINILKHTKTIDILLTNMIELLQNLEQDYKKNIKINL